MNTLKAFALGVRDGFSSPYYISTSYNVDHLYNGRNNPWETFDRGINWGQFLRAGTRSEAWQEHFKLFRKQYRTTPN